MSNQLICMGIIGMIFTQKKYEEMKKREKDSKRHTKIEYHTCNVINHNDDKTINAL